MDRVQRRAVALGFAAAGLVLAILLSTVGVEAFLTELRAADRRLAALAVGLVCLWLVWWGLALRIVLAAMDVRVSTPRAVLVFAGAMFANNVTPFGQAGGEPITAFLIAESIGVAYERGLAAVAEVDALNLVPSVAFALAGVGYLAVTRTLGGTIAAAALAVGGLAVGIPLLFGVAWRSRRRLEGSLVSALTPVARWIGAIAPRVSPPDRDDVADRVGGFFDAIERTARDPRRLLLAFGCSAAGWASQILAFWIALRAVGVAVPLAVAMVVVPGAAVAGAAPLPGGVGGIEAALVVMLSAPPVGVDRAAALAAVVIFRGTVYWLPTLLGGVVSGVVAARSAAA